MTTASPSFGEGTGGTCCTRRAHAATCASVRPAVVPQVYACPGRAALAVMRGDAASLVEPSSQRRSEAAARHEEARAAHLARRAARAAWLAAEAERATGEVAEAAERFSDKAQRVASEAREVAQARATGAARRADAAEEAAARLHAQRVGSTRPAASFEFRSEAAPPRASAGFFPPPAPCLALAPNERPKLGVSRWGHADGAARQDVNFALSARRQWGLRLDAAAAAAEPEPVAAAVADIPQSYISPSQPRLAALPPSAPVAPASATALASGAEEAHEGQQGAGAPAPAAADALSADAAAPPPANATTAASATAGSPTKADASPEASRREGGGGGGAGGAGGAAQRRAPTGHRSPQGGSHGGSHGGGHAASIGAAPAVARRAKGGRCTGWGDEASVPASPPWACVPPPWSTDEDPAGAAAQRGGAQRQRSPLGLCAAMHGEGGPDLPALAPFWERRPALEEAPRPTEARQQQQPGAAAAAAAAPVVAAAGAEVAEAAVAPAEEAAAAVVTVRLKPAAPLSSRAALPSPAVAGTASLVGSPRAPLPPVCTASPLTAELEALLSPRWSLKQPRRPAHKPPPRPPRRAAATGGGGGGGALLGAVGGGLVEPRPASVVRRREEASSRVFAQILFARAERWS